MMGIDDLTHDALVKRGAQWLAGTRRCCLVFEEYNCWATREFPDCIGWTVQGYSILIECKVSIHDFKRDHRKPAKLLAKSRGKETLGRERWYLTPPGLLDPSMIPEGFGLLEEHKGRMKRIVEASTDERPGREAAELPILIHAARKQAWSEGWKGRAVRLASIAVPPKP